MEFPGDAVPEKLLEKYVDERLPRYTSYPTAPNFSAQVGPADYRRWLAALPAGQAVSLYLHIPFCREMCWYCGCHTKITHRNPPIAQYLAALEQEIVTVARLASHRLAAGHIHFGGGTPTIIGPSRFLDLTALLRANFKIDAAAELAVEIDPRTLAADMVDALAEAGVRRVSLGVQSFDPLVQQAINRVQSIDETRSAVLMLREAGIAGVNFDLIYGLPRQSVASCVATAQQAVALRPDRLSVFGYAHIPSFKTHQKMIDPAAVPDGTARHEQAEAIAATLVAAGYRRIGLDHYALPGDGLTTAQESGRLHRNFQGYTTDPCATVIGFGASSIGRCAAGFVQNEVAIARYVDQAMNGQLATVRGYVLTDDDRLRARVIERLMCDFEVDVAKVCSGDEKMIDRLLSNNARLQALIADGLVRVNGSRITVDRGARFIVRKVAAAFDAHLGRTGRTHSTAA